MCIRDRLNINRLTQMCDKYKDKNIRIMMVPSAAAILSEKLPDFAPFYDDNKITEMIKSQLNDKNIIIDTASILQEHKDEYIYYKTDHHWTSLGAYYAYTQWAQSIGTVSYTHLGKYQVLVATRAKLLEAQTRMLCMKALGYDPQLFTDWEENAVNNISNIPV